MTIEVVFPSPHNQRSFSNIILLVERTTLAVLSVDLIISPKF